MRERVRMEACKNVGQKSLYQQHDCSTERDSKLGLMQQMEEPRLFPTSWADMRDSSVPESRLHRYDHSHNYF
jgi:hypothetical protein